MTPRADLSIKKLLMLGSDGPAVNKKVFKLLNEELKELRPRKGMIDIGTCSIHIVHNSFLKGMEEFGEEISDFIILIYYYYKKYPVRLKEYSEVQNLKKVANNMFIKHASTRWLTIISAAERIIEQLPAIKHYFSTYLPKYNKRATETYKYKQIIKMLKISNLEAQCMHVIQSATLFCKFTEFFQKEEPLVHILYDELKALIISIASIICKNNKSKLTEMFQTNNFLDINNIIIDPRIKPYVTGNERSVLDFKKSVRNHFLASGKYLLNKTALMNKNIKYFKCIQPKVVKENYSLEYFSKMFDYLKIIECSSAVDEYRLLKFEKLPTYERTQRIDVYWNSFYESDDRKGKYKHLHSVFKAAFAISHGNASVERGFSRSKLILSEDKTAMSLKTLNARLHIANGLKLYNNLPHVVPITSELLHLAGRARQSYKEYLEKKREEALKERQQNEEWKAQQEETTLMENLAKQSKKSLEELNEILAKEKKSKMEKEESADKLLKEGHVRLKVALSANNIMEARVAQGLIDGAIALRTEERSSSKNMEQVEKRKNVLISHYFSKTVRKE